VKHVEKARLWIGESVSRRLAIPGLILILLLLVQAAISGASAIRLVGRLEDSSAQSNASLALTERLLTAARELSEHARATVDATDDDARHRGVASFNETKARLGEVVDEISTQLSGDPQLQQAVSEGVSSFVVSGVKATRLAEKGRIEDAQRELQQNFSPALLAYVISTVTTLNQTSSDSLSGVLRAGRRDFWIAMGVTLILVLIAVGAGFWAFRAIRGSVIEPVRYAARTARRLATGDYARVQLSDKRDECGELVRVMDELCEQLIARRDAADAAAAAAVGAFRVRSGLDLASSCVLITGPEGQVIYANTAARSLMARIQRGSSLEGRALEDLLAFADANEGAVSPGSEAKRLRYGEVMTDVLVSTIVSESGETLGKVAEWVERTDEVRAQREVAAVVHAAGEGDFSQRIPVDGKSGYWGELARSLNQLTETFHSALHATSLELAALSQGELTATAKHAYQGLLAKVFDDLAASRGQLSRMVAQIREGSENVSTVASVIKSGNDTLCDQGVQLTGAITDAVRDMEELTAAVRRNADNAHQVGKLAGETRDAAVRGGTVVSDVVRSMSDVASTTARVVDVVKVIDEIAFRTNLLALNAAVEAAHAGDHGRGFAVVAAEVRALSQRCAESAGQIKQLIDACNATVRHGTTLVADAGKKIEDVVQRVAAMAGVVGEIASDAQQQCSGIESVARRITDVESSNRRNAGLLGQARDSAHELEELAGELGGAVGRFHIERAPAKSAKSAKPALRPAKLAS
jgi:methyl-accepting chemotaxis protein